MKHLMLMMVVAVSLVSQSAFAVGPIAKGEHGPSMICAQDVAVKGHVTAGAKATPAEQPASGSANDAR